MTDTTNEVPTAGSHRAVKIVDKVLLCPSCGCGVMDLVRTHIENSSRGVRMDFWCGGCGSTNQLAMRNHKGETMLEWSPAKISK